MSDIRVSALPATTPWARYVGTLCMAKGDHSAAAKLAERFRDSPQVAAVHRAASEFGGDFDDLPAAIERKRADIRKKTIEAVREMMAMGFETKSAVSIGDTQDAAWASPLAQYNNMASAFVAALRPQTILGKLPTRKVPFQIRYSSVNTGTNMWWVGQGLGTPVSKLSLATNTLGYAKASGICVITNELAQLSTPNAETVISDDMTRSARQYLDAQFIDPSVVAVANVSPASILNAVTPIVSGGSTSTLIAADLESAIGVLADANADLETAYWVMRPRDASRLAAKRDTTGGLTFPAINARGGFLLGFPVITSNSVPSSVSGGSIVAFVSGSGIDLALGMANVSVSGEASLQLSDAPATGAAQHVSLFQENLIGLKLTIDANWRKNQSGVATYLDACFW